MKALDPDDDGTIDMAEAEADELQGMLDEKGLDMADPDDDDSLDWKEYMALVAEKFKPANPDDDGTIDQKELDSPAGQELLKLIYKP